MRSLKNAKTSVQKLNWSTVFILTDTQVLIRGFSLSASISFFVLTRFALQHPLSRCSAYYSASIPLLKSLMSFKTAALKGRKLFSHVETVLLSTYTSTAIPPYRKGKSKRRTLANLVSGSSQLQLLVWGLSQLFVK